MGQYPYWFAKQQLAGVFTLAPAGSGDHPFMQVLALFRAQIDGQAYINILHNFLHFVPFRGVYQKGLLPGVFREKFGITPMAGMGIMEMVSYANQPANTMPGFLKHSEDVAFKPKMHLYASFFQFLWK